MHYGAESRLDHGHVVRRHAGRQRRQPHQEDEGGRDARQVVAGGGHRLGGALDLVRGLEDVPVGALHQGVQVGQGDRGLVLEPGQQAALDGSQLGCRVGKFGPGLTQFGPKNRRRRLGNKLCPIKFVIWSGFLLPL